MKPHLTILVSFCCLEMALLHIIENSSLELIIESLSMQNPTIQKKTKSMVADVGLMKKLSYNMQFSSIEYDNQKHNLSLMGKSKIISNFEVILAEEHKLYSMMNNSKLKIDRRLYFLKDTTLEVFEAYQINHVNVQRKLGYLEKDIPGIIWEKGIKKNFIQRRSNFQVT